MKRTMNARKKYSKGFKLDAISLVLNQEYTRSEAARSLEVNPNLITHWIKEHEHEHEQDNDGQAFRGKKASLRPNRRNLIKYHFIAKKKKTYPIDRMCQLLEVKRSGYYRWVKKMNDDIDPIHSEMIELVKEVAKAAENVYGSRRMKHALNGLSYTQLVAKRRVN